MHTPLLAKIMISTRYAKFNRVYTLKNLLPYGKGILSMIHLLIYFSLCAS